MSRTRAAQAHLHLVGREAVAGGSAGGRLGIRRRDAADGAVHRDGRERVACEHRGDRPAEPSTTAIPERHVDGGEGRAAVAGLCQRIHHEVPGGIVVELRERCRQTLQFAAAVLVAHPVVGLERSGLAAPDDAVGAGEAGEEQRAGIKQAPGRGERRAQANRALLDLQVQRHRRVSPAALRAASSQSRMPAESSTQNASSSWAVPASAPLSVGPSW